MSMGTNATQVQSILESLFLSALQKITTEGKGNFISDLYVQNSLGEMVPLGGMIKLSKVLAPSTIDR